MVSDSAGSLEQQSSSNYDLDCVDHRLVGYGSLLRPDFP
jgi:hypothetical protein